MAEDELDLASLRLTPGEGRQLTLDVGLDVVRLAGDEYRPRPARPRVTIDVSRMVGGGYALRLRTRIAPTGPCMRCLRDAEPEVDVDVRELDDPSADDEQLDSPYVDGERLALSSWVRDAFVLALPDQILCRPDCAGLCPECGVVLDEHPGHAHERAPDPRWAALSALRLEDPEDPDAADRAAQPGGRARLGGDGDDEEPDAPPAADARPPAA